MEDVVRICVGDGGSFDLGTSCSHANQQQSLLLISSLTLLIIRIHSLGHEILKQVADTWANIQAIPFREGPLNFHLLIIAHV